MFSSLVGGGAAAVEREESAGDDEAAVGHTATGFLLGEGMLETFERGGKSFQSKFGARFACGGELVAGVLPCFVGLGQGCLTCLGTAVGFIRVGGRWFQDRAGIGGRGENDRSFHRFELKQSAGFCAPKVLIILRKAMPLEKKFMLLSRAINIRAF